ncbi:MAG: HIT domain-containing protein [Myxococcaceae bacterium]|nr:HIT domain-containing protein [Myxococcaceae bacterium]MBH2006866.1 HIT domain-containing protein [Myxococcaceae bacterium]
MSDCLFCQIVSGNVSAQIVAQTDSLIAFQDIHPQAPKHVLIIPKEHIESAKTISQTQSALIGQMVLLAQELNPERDFRLTINAGVEAGQSVFHLHMHVLSGRSFSWPPG